MHEMVLPIHEENYQFYICEKKTLHLCREIIHYTKIQNTIFNNFKYIYCCIVVKIL